MTRHLGLCIVTLLLALGSAPATGEEIGSVNFYARCNGSGCGAPRIPTAAENRKAFLPGCLQGDAQSCDIVGTAERWLGNQKAANRFYDKACRLDGRYGCSNLGAQAMKSRKATVARALFQRACEAGHDMGCRNLAQMNHTAFAAHSAALAGQ